MPPLDIATEINGMFDYIHLFVKTQAEFNEHFLKLKLCLKSNGMLWVCWPKGGKLGTDLNMITVDKKRIIAVVRTMDIKIKILIIYITRSREGVEVKKKIFLMIIFLILFVSCKPSRNKNASDTPTVTNEPTVEPTPLHEQMIELAPSSENVAWAEAYADFLMKNNYPPRFILLDVDFDGIPELFFYTSGYGANKPMEILEQR